MRKVNHQFKHHAQLNNCTIAQVDVAEQTMRVFCNGVVVRNYRVSTASAGVGAESGSGKTPPGRHRVARMFGHGTVPGQVFVSRRAVKGNVIPSAEWQAGGDRDYVLTRVLWLDGLEPGVNKGIGIDSHDRYIYIHGTNQEHLLGMPASHGCIRMSNVDVIDFFNFVKSHRDVIIEIVV